MISIFSQQTSHFQNIFTVCVFVVQVTGILLQTVEEEQSTWQCIRSSSRRELLKSSTRLQVEYLTSANTLKWQVSSGFQNSCDSLSLSQVDHTVQSEWTWLSKPCCARSLVTTSSRVSNPSGQQPGWTSPSHLKRGNGWRRQAEPTPSTSPCPSLSSTTTRGTGGRAWRPPWGGASECGLGESVTAGQSQPASWWFTSVPSLSCASVSVSMNIVKWSSQGMLRLTQEAMNELFQPTIVNVVKHIGEKYTVQWTISRQTSTDRHKSCVLPNSL